MNQNNLSERHWDKTGKYSQYDIKKYQYWLITLSTRQHTLGSCIIFCLRPNVLKFSELKTEEVIELIQVHKELEERITKQFQTDHFNYCQYGNELKVFHEHVIPRYNKSQKRFGVEWVDLTPTSLPIWKFKDDSESLLNQIKNLI